MADSQIPGPGNDLNASSPQTGQPAQPKRITINDSSDQAAARPAASQTEGAMSDVEPEPAPDESPVVTDSKTEQAVDDIAKADGDTILRAQDEAAEKAVVMKLGAGERIKDFWVEWWDNPKKKWGTIGGLLAVLLVLLAIPLTRATMLGVALKGSITVQAVDSKTGTPVTGATVALAGTTVQTDANGRATVSVHAGSKTLVLSKKYYRSVSRKELVPIPTSSKTIKLPMVALGRQINLKLIDKISGKPLVTAEVSAQGTKSKSNSKGVVTLVLSASSTKQTATVSLTGYNTTQITLSSDSSGATNTFEITPAGKLYFLSNLSGKIDVVKTNLDGTDRQTVLAGTGTEDRNSTSLLASRDWKYLALLSKRSGNNASVYLIDTTNGDKLTTVDEGDASFSFVGWSGDRFIYRLTRNNVQNWQSNQQALKSLDATTGQTLLLDQTQASGTNSNDYVGQSFGSPYIVGDQVVYTKAWNASYTNPSALNGKQAEFDTIGADGSQHKTVKTFALDSYAGQTYVGLTATLYEPSELYVLFQNGSQQQFYDYEDGKLSSDTSMTSDKFYNTPYPTYLLSPSGNATFWADQRDGKNTLFVGDQNASAPKQIATLSDYTTYGWFTDNYLLVSKNSSELYIMPAAGGTPLKLTDYYKPAINYNGYGGGYGGL